MEIDEDGDKHFQFAKEISKKFVGRAVLLQKALEHINAGDVIKEDKNLLVISGQNGSGKTAYMVSLLMFTESIDLSGIQFLKFPFVLFL